jgi:serine/threonine-protein kinase
MRLLREGQIIRETYDVERFLGEGAFSEVYRVKHRFLGRQAMKVMKAPGMKLEEIEAMLEEALLLSHMGHPNIIRVFDANTVAQGGSIYGFYTMEYVAGGSLEQFWRSHGARFMPVETAVEILRQACRGLAVGHSEQPPIIHRDIKPQNILIGYDAAGLRVRVSDFGLARRVNPLTLLASARGTRIFKSPETFTDAQSDSRAGDVWALGATLYLLLTDRLPFFAPEDAVRLKKERFLRPLAPPSSLNLHVDPELDVIVSKALALKPEDRYQEAKELLSGLEAWRPGKKTTSKKRALKTLSDESKSALGVHTPANEEVAKKKAEQALQLAKQASRLMEAADMMEEALNEWPELREKYQYQLSLWRRGLIM